MMPVYALVTVMLFTFGASIFYVLAAIERRVCGRHVSHPSADDEADIRLVHRMLTHLLPVLPVSNGVVVVGGLAALLWQAIARDWDWRSSVVVAWFLGVQLYIIVVGRIASAVKRLRTTPTGAKLAAVRRAVVGIARQHRNGFIHAVGVLVLELTLIIVPLHQPGI